MPLADVEGLAALLMYRATHPSAPKKVNVWPAAVALQGTQALQPPSIRGLAFMPHKGLLTAQLGTGGMRLNAGGVFNAVGWTRYQGALL
jgi:hypothetical protein